MGMVLIVVIVLSILLMLGGIIGGTAVSIYHAKYEQEKYKN